MRVLVFGDTPLARRLTHYIDRYAVVKGVDAMVVRRPLQSTTSFADVQRDVWNAYVTSNVEGRPDLVINAHEESRLDYCETDPTAAWRTNTRHAAWITYAARTADIPLVLCSTDHVFRGAVGPYAAERDIRDETPVNVYGVTKWYAEQIAVRLYPKLVVDSEWRHPGTTVVRTSDLYGADVPHSIPAKLTHVEDGETMTHGVVRNDARVTPSFIGEVAFLFARNLLLSPQSLNAPVIHIGPDLPPWDWASYLHSVGVTVMYQKPGEERRANPEDRLHRQGHQRGLKPTPGWFLPSDINKSFADFISEYRETAPPYEYVSYWDAE